MAAESVVSSAIVTGTANGSGVALAWFMFSAEQSIALGSIGGCCMFLAASATLPWSSRIFYAIGSCIFGFLSGIFVISLGSNSAGGAVAALIVSSLASWLIGSLKAWSDGGPKPGWLDWAQEVAGVFLPSFLKRGKPDD